MEFCTNVALHQLNKELKSCDGTKFTDATVSPLGMCVILQMIGHGANGATLDQLLQFLGVKTVDDLVSKAKNLTQISKSSCDKKDYEDSEEDPKIFNFNGAFVREGFSLKKSYQDFLELVFQAHVKNVDFSRGDEAVKEENEWVAFKTNGLIKKLFLDGAFTASLMLMLANGLYFKGKWVNEFDPKHTELNNFYLLNEAKSPIQVPSMWKRNAWYDYASFDDYKVLKMPYKRGQDTSRQFSMVIILPNEIRGLPSLVEKFRENPSLLSNNHLNLEKNEIDVLMVPKFKHKYVFQPCETMEQLGLTMPFECRDEFKGMIDDVPLYVSTIVQHTEIECNEKGTEVVCVTYVGLDTGFSLFDEPPPPPIEFIVDHPFMFMIKEDISDTIFFLGVICEPEVDENFIKVIDSDED